MIMKIVLAVAVAFYLIMAVSFFKSWLLFFQQDTELSPKRTFFSWVVLTVVTLLWPVVVPFAYLELLRKLQKSKANQPPQNASEDLENSDLQAGSVAPTPQDLEFNKLLGIPVIKN